MENVECRKGVIELLLGDITTLKVDAIVNSANPSLYGGDGLSGYIHFTAGKEMTEECKRIGKVEAGKVKITRGYKLPARFVIHAVGPVYYQGFKKDPVIFGKTETEDELLTRCYEESLKLAQAKKLKTIAFPCIATGLFGFPKEKAAAIAVSVVKNFMEKNGNDLDKVTFVVHNATDYRIYHDLLN